MVPEGVRKDMHRCSNVLSCGAVFFVFVWVILKMRLGASTSPKEALVVEDYTHSMGEL